MTALLPVSRHVGDGKAGRVIRERCKAAHTVGVQECLGLLDNLLVLFVSGAELSQPGVIAVLDGISTRLLIPSGDYPTQQ